MLDFQGEEIMITGDTSGEPNIQREETFLLFGQSLNLFKNR